jgi:TorA maturation chaperone TorD
MSSAGAAGDPVLAPEDEGRLHLYALLARVFSAGPDDSLLRALADSAGSIEGEGDLALAWDDLARAAREASAHAATLEFDAVFVGTGKAPVSTYLSHYHPVARKEVLLVELRDTLAQLGLGRTATSSEPEDNLATVLEVMRHLVAAGSDAQSLRRQRDFFIRYLVPGYKAFCGATHKVELSDYHRAAVHLLEVFIESDLAQFEMA